MVSFVAEKDVLIISFLVVYMKKDIVPILNENFLFAIMCKIFWEKIKKSSKVRQDRKLWYMFLNTFWAQVSKIYLSREDGTPDCVLMQFWDFSNIFLFPKILSLKLFGNTWGNLYRSFVLNIMFHFAYGEWNMYQDFVKF